MAYRSEDKSDRWKAIVAVILVHVVLGAAILTGLNVNIVGEAVERLETFDVSLEQPPPEQPPPPPPREAEQEQGAPAAPKASPIVAPKPEVQIPVQNPIAAAPEAGTGASSSAGQGGVGTGTGAGGTGTGAGRGGGGGGSASTPARLVRNLTNSDYRGLTGNRLPRGSAALALHVDARGRVDGCRVIRSSGDSVVDSGICALIARRLRFAPARDAQGRPVPSSTNYMATWNRR